MRKLAVAGVLLATCTLAAAQEPQSRDDAAHGGSTWLGWLWPWGGHPEPKKAADKDDAPSSAEVAAARRRHVEAVLARRIDVIIKLRGIAWRTGDDVLLRKCDELDEQANEVYLQHTLVPAEEPAGAARHLPKGPAASTVSSTERGKGDK
jgi:hypothetical protein